VLLVRALRARPRQLPQPCAMSIGSGIGLGSTRKRAGARQQAGRACCVHGRALQGRRRSCTERPVAPWARRAPSRARRRAELCYKCQRPGHVARDCPDAAAAPAWGAPGARAAGDASAVCLRCGRPDCAAAGQGDFVRCRP